MIKSASLFTSTAIGLLALSVPLAAAPGLPAQLPQMGLVVLAQASVQEAEAQLRAAMENLQAVTDAGGDVGAAQAEVDAAQQALQAAQGAAAEAEAQKAAEEEAAKQAEAEAQRAAEEEAAKQAEAEAQKAAEEEAAKQAEAEAQKAAEEEAAKQAEAEAQRAAEEEAAKQAEAEAQKAAEEEAARKAAEEAEKAKEEQPAAEQPAEQPAQPEAPAEQPAEPEAPAAEQPAEPEQPAQPEEPAQPAQPEQPAQPQAEQPAQPEAPAEQPTQPEAPAAEEPAEQPAQPEQPAEPQAEEPAQPEAPAEQPAQPAQPEAPAEQPAQPEAPAAEQPAQPEQPAEQPAQPEAPAGEQPAGEQPAQPDQTQAPAPEDLAPILDSQKPGDAPVAPDGQQQPEVAAPAEPAAPPPPPPADDRAAQPQDIIVNIAPVTEEQAVGERRRPDRAEEFLPPVETFPEAPKVVERVVGGLILQFGTQIIVERSDRERLSRRADDVYVEELRNGRTRETIVKADGVQIITVRNRWGEIIRRSRVEPDGAEYVLVYAPYLEEERAERPREWYDPGRDLPPMRLTIPVREYILDAGEADEAEFVEFLAKPPVEKVERLYSIDEVRRSARIRDKVRRVDLDNITFDTGSASVSAKGIRTLQGVADAMAEMIGKNPAESFLIEGHTDAVGSDVSNLSLSDQRAEAVAVVLSEVYRIPSENLVTQGYGERYLKVKTEGAERLNRRVAIRRISTLVSPEVAGR